MATVDEDLSTLEKDIRQLKVEFDMYFGGGRKRPPTDIQWRVEQMIKRYSERGGQMNFSQRFRFNNLTQSYAKQSEVWRKRMKQREEGTVERHFGAAAKAIEAQRQKEAAARPKEEPEAAADGRRPAPASGPAPVFQIACADPDKEQDKVQQLYQRLVEAKRQAGEKTDSLTLENFSEFVRQKTQQLKKQKKTEQVEYAITVEDGQVKLKARTR